MPSSENRARESWDNYVMGPGQELFPAGPERTLAEMVFKHAFARGYFAGSKDMADHLAEQLHITLSEVSRGPKTPQA